MVRVSSIFVGGETGDVDAAGVAVDTGVVVSDGVDVGVEVGDTLSVRVADIGDNSSSGEASFCGDGVLLGVGDFAAFDGVTVGVGVRDLGGSAGEDFDFGVDVGFGVGVCALRSTPR